MPLFSIPLSGLSASANALSVIADNLANLNTVGFKEQSAQFRDLFYQSLGTTGSGNAMQLGTGVAIGAVSSNFTDGILQPTGVSTDAAITGNGFFVVQKTDGGQAFTRAGNFTVNNAGLLTTQSGDLVLGYPAVNGVITPTALSPLVLGKGTVIPASPTTTAQLTLNLDSNTAVGGSAPSTPLTVYDSLGNSHILSVQFTKTAANAWSYQVTVPGADVGSATAVTVASGNLTFDAQGKLTSPLTPQAVNVTGLVDGAQDMAIAWQMVDANGAPIISQVAGMSGTASTYQNGFSSGTLRDYSINSNGIIDGQFSNGQRLALGQIALATFSNNDGLLRVGENEYVSTQSSGAAAIGAPLDAGRGKLTGGNLENSNVDMATEFSKMIVNQRGYEANAKVFTAFDEVTQDTINMKR